MKVGGLGHPLCSCGHCRSLSSQLGCRPGPNAFCIRLNKGTIDHGQHVQPFKNQLLCVYSCEFVLFVERLQRMTVNERQEKLADVCGEPFVARLMLH
jgi:hypothetical protein